MSELQIGAIKTILDNATNETVDAVIDNLIKTMSIDKVEGLKTKLNSNLDKQKTMIKTNYREILLKKIDEFNIDENLVWEIKYEDWYNYPLLKIVNNGKYILLPLNSDIILYTNESGYNLHSIMMCKVADQPDNLYVKIGLPDNLIRCENDNSEKFLEINNLLNKYIKFLPSKHHLYDLLVEISNK